MTQRYRQTLFTPLVKDLQQAHGSRDHYSTDEATPSPPDRFGPDETAFIEAADSFYMASVSATGWPYLQHRGGPCGFLRVTSPETLSFADLRGNRQYISTGNIAGDDRVALFIMDYPRKARLKIIGHARALPLDAPAARAVLTAQNAARAERVIQITLDGFDWNCPQYITPRYTEEDLRAVTAKMGQRIAELEAALAKATGG